MFCLSGGSVDRLPAPSKHERADVAALWNRALVRPAAVWALCVGLLFVSPAQAQIASYVDSHGKTVYVNAEPRIKARRHVPGPLVVAMPVKYQGVVNAAAVRNNLDPALVKAVIQTESNWNPYAVSRKGAFGLMQLIPSTAERYGVRDVFDPAQNVKGGTRYLRDLMERYHGDLKKSLAAYNAGEQAVQRFNGVPKYPETRAYVRKVTTTYFHSGPMSAAQISALRQSPIRQVTGRTGRTVFTNE